MIWGYIYDVHFGKGWWIKGKSDVRGWEVSECFGLPILFFIIKENWICAITEPNINVVLTRNLPFDSVKPSFHDTIASSMG